MTVKGLSEREVVANLAIWNITIKATGNNLNEVNNKINTDRNTVMYHFVWIPKYRHKIFIEPYRESLKLIIKKIGYDYNIEIVELEIPVDHVHMIVKSEPKLSPSDIMQIIKSISARNFFKLYPQIKRKYFWGGKLWTQSFFCRNRKKCD